MRVRARRGQEPRQNSAHRKEVLDAKDVKQDAAVDGIVARRCGIEGPAAGTSGGRRRKDRESQVTGCAAMLGGRSGKHRFPRDGGHGR